MAQVRHSNVQNSVGAAQPDYRIHKGQFFFPYLLRFPLKYTIFHKTVPIALIV